MATTTLARARLAFPFLAFLAAGVAAGDPTTSPTIHTDLEEQATAWLAVVRLRIEPTHGATLGVCRRLGPEDLVAVVRNRELSGRKFLRLDRVRPPTLHALVLDNSASMVDRFEWAKIAARDYVRQLDPHSERALLMTFDESVIHRQSPTRDRERLVRAIADLRTGSRTSLLDAVYYAARELDAHRERPVLILLSDGADTSSYYTPSEIEQQIRSRPDLTVFTIGVGVQTRDGNKPTRDLLQRIAEQTHGSYFEVTEERSAADVFSRIRDTLDNEVILTAVIPGAKPEAQKIQVYSRNANCNVTLLHTLDERAADAPISRPYPDPPQTFQAELEPTHFAALRRGAEQDVHPACAGRLGARDGTTLGPGWYLEAAPRSAAGCVPDITRDHGRLFTPPQTVASNDRLRLTARPFEVPIGPLDTLPHRPEEALDVLARRVLELKDAGSTAGGWPAPGAEQATPFENYPYLVHGSTFLEMRPMLARAAFLYPDYRTWTAHKLAAEGEVEIALLVERYRRAFPAEPAAMVESAARFSEEGSRITARVDAPSVVDLEPLLAAWLGDISAHDLFLRWERRHIDRAIAGEPSTALDVRFLEAWRELRQVLFAPSHARVLTLLVPVRDEDCDCVGYWRIELPRPGWISARATGRTADRDETGDFLDLVPDVPAGWLAFERLVQETPGLLDSLRERGFRAADLKYRLESEPTLRDPQNAYAAYAVELDLGPAIAGAAEGDLLVLRPELRRASDGNVLEPEYVDLTIETGGGAVPADLAEGLRAAGRRILGIEEVATAAPPPADVPAIESSASGGAPVPGPVERATVTAVVVPVVVRRGDEPLRGLTAQNFELFDEGDKRDLKAVEFVDVTDGAASPTGDLPPAARRHLLFLFDLSFSDAGAVARARAAVLEALGRLHESDLAAVAVYNADKGSRLVQDFTTDRARLKRAVEGLGPPIGELRAGAVPGGEGDVAADAGPGSSEAEGGSSAGSAGGNDAAREHFETIQSEMESSSRTDQAARVERLCRDLRGIAKWLYGVPGRKQVVFLSEGFDSSLVFASANAAEQREQSESVESGAIWDVDSQRRFGDTGLQSALDAALEEFRRADSPIQAVHISPPGAPGGRSGEGGLHAMARGTGGELYPASSDLDASLGRLLQRTGTFYVLVFQPGELRPDGQFHKLRVRLKDVPRGTRAVHRPGYFAPPPPQGN